MNPGARRAARAKALSRPARKAQGVSVPRGSRPLLSDRQRFEIALWLVFRDAGMPIYEAAYLVALLLGPFEPLPLALAGDHVRVLTGDALVVHDITNRAEYLARKAELAAIRACDETRSQAKHELGWLTHSTAYLNLAIRHIDNGTTSIAFDELRRLGWGETLVSIAHRWRLARQSNFPPHTEMLSRAVAALIARAKKVKP